MIIGVTYQPVGKIALLPISPSRPRLPAPQRREAILDAALGLFAPRGYEAASIGEIAAAAGVTRPVLYDHFGSKQDLYVSLVEREATRMMGALTSRHDPNAPLEERLRTLAAGAVGFARRNPNSSQLLFQTPVGNQTVRVAHEEVRALSHQAIATAILADPAFEALRGLSRKASADLLADLHGAVLERLVRWAIDHPGVSTSSLSEVFVAVLWKGLA
jgi:AcrR family transcriptional regulator